MNRNQLRSKRDALTVITVVAIAGLVQAGSVSAGNGKSNESGHGKSTEEIVLLKKRGENGKVEQGGEASGAVASSLRHLNGPVHASDIALERANERSNLGQARSYRDAALAERQTDIELGHKRDRLTALGAERTVEVIQAEIDALDPVADADRIALLEQEKAGARTDAEVGADINRVLAEIEALESTRIGWQAASAGTYEDMTGGRNLITDTVLVLRSALGLD
jgi:hypothetical protein